MTSPLRTAGWSVAAIALATLLTAFYFQHVLGYQPCQMCLWQRWAYYAGIPLAIIAALTGRRELLLAAAALFAANAVLGGFHAGVEWDLWEGPASCGQGAVSSSGNLLEDLKTIRVVPCDAAAWRFLGLSFAGWSAVICAVLAAIAVCGARRK